MGSLMIFLVTQKYLAILELFLIPRTLVNPNVTNFHPLIGLFLEKYKVYLYKKSIILGWYASGI